MLDYDRKERSLSYSKLFVLVFILIFVFIWLLPSKEENYSSENEKPLIILITPTHDRIERLADMTRMSQTVKQIENVHWIVVEDGNRRKPSVEMILHRSDVPFVYLSTKSDPELPRRGWTHRNLALRYVTESYGSTNAVVYFADDDNTYDLRLFNDYIRNVKRIGMWAVGLVGGAFVEAPHVEDGKITKFDVMFAPKRKFATDMAGFAIHLSELQRTKAQFDKVCAKTQKEGPESCFLSKFGLNLTEIEPFGHDANPKEIFVWHTKTTSIKAKGPNHGYLLH